MEVQQRSARGQGEPHGACCKIHVQVVNLPLSSSSFLNRAMHDVTTDKETPLRNTHTSPSLSDTLGALNMTVASAGRHWVGTHVGR